jgi:hypothetical protein
MTPNANCARTEIFTVTEVLHYEDGSTLENGTKTIRREPSLAVSRLARSGSTFDFWNGHDPRIVAVEFIYAPA